MSIPLCHDIASLREHVAAWRAGGKLVALVPTMGALHDGHLALVKAAREVADRVVVSIFVNPKQFAANEDFASYPRNFEQDCIDVDLAGADLVYAPDIATMYPQGFATSISVEGPAVAGLEDAFRPGHFTGVATIVVKLLMQALPNVAMFGEKDWQLLKTIERLAIDLDLPIGIVSLPTVREGDGIAMSSRNLYLDSAARAQAPTLYDVLSRCAVAIGAGESIENSTAAARARLEDAGFAVDYVAVRHAATLAPLGDDRERPARLLAAARIGGVRLIDNLAI